MEAELRQQAKKKVYAKLAFFQCVIIFSVAAVVLLMLSLYLTSVSFWLRLPIPVLFMVLGVLYVSAYGLPTADGPSDNWEEEEIEKEMNNLRRRQKVQLPPLQDLSELDRLELKELERLQDKWEVGEDYV
ncbi:2TM domain-containing protein [Neolewinella persica]|uniref:2TM domain-containing protein n=1 Tax=Neolewinella persica TaxID=70998 RepID=UPI000380ECAF|nr:2TM domain-containing protein [Neolewinella persica]